MNKFELTAEEKARQDEAYKQAAKAFFDNGYEKAPLFLEKEKCSVLDLIKTLSMPGCNTMASEIYTDAGALKWCFEQLEKGQ